MTSENLFRLEQESKITYRHTGHGWEVICGLCNTKINYLRKTTWNTWCREADIGSPLGAAHWYNNFAELFKEHAKDTKHQELMLLHKLSGEE